MPVLSSHAKILLIFTFFLPCFAFAGPPFLTDDPEPVDYMHWEFYVSSVQQIESGSWNATLPHFEVNYGALPNVQVHVIAPLSFVHTDRMRIYGYSDTEFGIKYRFVQETCSMPQIGTFPLVELPTGDQNDLLGHGTTQVYAPIWIQKTWGNFTTYGGAGYWFNPGSGNKNWLFTGYEGQYDFSEVLTLGGEFYYHTADAEGSTANEGFNVGGYINVTEHHHILFSFGSTLASEKITTGYIGYQYTI